MSKTKTIGIITMSSDENQVEKTNSQRFQEELESKGHKAEILIYDRFFASFQKGKIEVFYNEEKLDVSRYDLFILVANGKMENCFLIEILESMGCTVKNTSRAVYLSKHKARTALNLSRAGLPVIPSAMNFSEYRLAPVMDFIKDDEYIAKLVDKSHGKGVAYINSRLSFISVFEMIAAMGISPVRMIFEKYIKQSHGQDFRVIVSGGKVVASMERRSNGFDFRSNILGCGEGKKARLTSAMEKTALKACKTLGLDFAGVDLLKTSKGPLIVEVNPNPGLKIEDYTNKNVAGEIIGNLVK